MTTGPNRVLAALVGVVVLLAVVAGVVVSRRDVPVLDPRTPEGATQAFVEALIDGRTTAAAAMLAPGSGCDIHDVARTSLPEGVRVVLESTTADADVAVVTLRVTDTYGSGPFDAAEYTHVERVTLTPDNGAWLVSGSSWLLPSCDPAKG